MNIFIVKRTIYQCNYPYSVDKILDIYSSFGLAKKAIENRLLMSFDVQGWHQFDNTTWRNWGNALYDKEPVPENQRCEYSIVEYEVLDK